MSHKRDKFRERERESHAHVANAKHIEKLCWHLLYMTRVLALMRSNNGPFW